MYCLAPEKTLRLVYEPFCLAIHVTFYETINHEFTDQELNSVSVKFFSKLSENIQNAAIISGVIPLSLKNLATRYVIGYNIFYD